MPHHEQTGHALLVRRHRAFNSRLSTTSLRLLTILVLTLMMSITTAASTTIAAPAAGPGKPDFGPNVIIFDPSMPTSQIQATVDAIATQQVDNEMGTQRYALGSQQQFLVRDSSIGGWPKTS